MGTETNNGRHRERSPCRCFCRRWSFEEWRVVRTAFEVGEEIAREYLPTLVRTGVLDETERAFQCGFSGMRFPHAHGPPDREQLFQAEDKCFYCGQKLPDDVNCDKATQTDMILEPHPMEVPLTAPTQEHIKD